MTLAIEPIPRGPPSWTIPATSVSPHRGLASCLSLKVLVRRYVFAQDGRTDAAVDFFVYYLLHTTTQNKEDIPFEILEHVNIGAVVLEGVKMSYSQSATRIIVNKSLSERIRGVHALGLTQKPGPYPGPQAGLGPPDLLFTRARAGLGPKCKCFGRAGPS